MSTSHLDFSFLLKKQFIVTGDRQRPPAVKRQDYTGSPESHRTDSAEFRTSYFVSVHYSYKPELKTIKHFSNFSIFFSSDAFLFIFRSQFRRALEKFKLTISVLMFKLYFSGICCLKYSKTIVLY